MGATVFTTATACLSNITSYSNKDTTIKASKNHVLLILVEKLSLSNSYFLLININKTPC